MRAMKKTTRVRRAVNRLKWWVNSKKRGVSQEAENREVVELVRV
jgi:hypothetical protein